MTDADGIHMFKYLVDVDIGASRWGISGMVETGVTWVVLRCKKSSIIIATTSLTVFSIVTNTSVPSKTLNAKST